MRRKCLTATMSRVRATLDAADRTACEFTRERRIQFLQQAIQREHEDVSEADALGCATSYVAADE